MKNLKWTHNKRLSIDGVIATHQTQCTNEIRYKQFLPLHAFFNFCIYLLSSATLNLLKLTSSGGPLLIESKLHLFQYFWCISNDKFHHLHCLLQQFNSFLVVFSVDRLPRKKIICVDFFNQCICYWIYEQHVPLHWRKAIDRLVSVHHDGRQHLRE